MIKLEIADLVIEINIPIKVLPDNMYSFLYKGSKDTDIFWDIEYGDRFKIGDIPYMKNDDVVIYKSNDKTIFQYKKEVNVPFVIIAKNEFRDCRFYVTKNFENYDKYNKNMEKQMKDGLQRAFKEMFIYACVYNGRLPLESSSVVYDDKAYLFTSKKGVGKSTQAKLWAKEMGCVLLNDKFVVAHIENEDEKKVTVYGCPWTEVNVENLNKKYDFGGIAFIVRSKSNVIYDLDKEDVGMRLLDNLNVTFIDKAIVDNVTVMLNRLCRCIKGYLLECNEKSEAVSVAKKEMIKS